MHMMTIEATSHSSQDVNAALDVLKKAVKMNQRIKVNENGDVHRLDMPSGPFAKLVYIVKQWLFSKEERTIAMDAILKKMKSNIGKAEEWVNKIFASKAIELKNLGINGNIEDLEKSWNEISRNQGIHDHSRQFTNGVIESTRPVEQWLQDILDSPSANSLPRVKGIVDQLTRATLTDEDVKKLKKQLAAEGDLPAEYQELKLGISSLIAIQQAMEDGKTFDKAIDLVEKRLEYLPRVREALPPYVKIDCIHEGVSYRGFEEVLSECYPVLDKHLATHQDYEKTTDENTVEIYPLSVNFDYQFVVDFYRGSDFTFKVNGRPYEPMLKAIEVMRTTENNSGFDDEKKYPVRNQWLEEFIGFFPNEQAAGVASYYLSQTVFGTLGEAKFLAAYSNNIASGSKAKIDFVIDLQDHDNRKKCVITATVSKIGSQKLVTLFPDPSNPDKRGIPSGEGKGMLDLVTDEAPTAAPVTVDQLTIQFDLDEMQKGIFNPVTLSARSDLNFQLNWSELDKGSWWF